MENSILHMCGLVVSKNIHFESGATNH